MTQAALLVPTVSNPPVTSPTNMAGDLNGAITALADGNAGASPPTNYGQTAGGGAGAPVQGQRWLDQSGANPVDRIYDGAVWQRRGVLDASQGVYTPISGGAFAITAAATTDLGTVPSDYVVVNGNTGITSFGSSAPIGARKQLRFTSNPVITNSANIACPWVMNLYVRAGATFVVMHLGAGVWIGLAYSDSGGAGAVPPGTLQTTAAIAAPDGWLLCYGQSLAVATYPGLYAALVRKATVTVSIASPAVVTWASGHPFRDDDPVKLRTTGLLPIGLAAGATYYAIYIDGTRFNLAASPGGAAINTTGTQSGTHTGYYAPYGDVDDSHFLAPDGRAVTLIGKGDMGGADSALITIEPDHTLGAEFGEQQHTLDAAEVPNLLVSASGPTSGTVVGFLANLVIKARAGAGALLDALSGTSAGAVVNTSSVLVSGAVSVDLAGGTAVVSGFTTSGGGGPHNNLQPSLVTNLIIKF